MAIAWIPPNLSGNMKDLISLKAFNVLSGEEGIVPKSLAIIPFPSQQLNGLIKTLEIQDKARRGGIIDSSIAVLFNESNALLFYQNINHFETLFNEAATKIINLVELSDTTKQELEDELNKFYKKIIGVVATSLQKKEEPKEIQKSLLLLFNLVRKDLDKVVNAVLMGDPIVVTGDKGLVELIINTLTIFCPDRTPKLVYWTEEFTSGDIIGGPSYLSTVFQTNLILDLTKGKVSGGRSNIFCKKLLKQARQLDSSQAELVIKHKLKKVHASTQELLNMITQHRVSPQAIEDFVTDLTEDEFGCIENYMNLKHPELSEKATEAISLCRKKMSKILSGFEKQKW
ncbi:MAG: hypothetical protein HWN66_17065 [Candidatus Helarchaeota archaeon]|nr:hypothetical protein [Candidatus Helarchaeota archaeon]